MLTSSSLDPSSPSSLSFPPIPSATPTKQVKLESPDVKQHEVSSQIQTITFNSHFTSSQTFPSLSLGETKDRQASYLWPGFQPPHYHLLWPGRPLPFLPTENQKEGDSLAGPHRNEPFFGLFFANNNLTKALAEEKRDDPVSKFMDGPFFRYRKQCQTMFNLKFIVLP